MSHDCDCPDCMETDSRWAPYRETQRALKEDCPRGVHVAGLLRCTLGEPDSAEYWCKHCRCRVDKDGKEMSKEWTIADRYFYQAGPLPEDRVEPVVEQVKCPCKKHRTYKAVRKPTSGCEECWRFYVKVHP